MIVIGIIAVLAGMSFPAFTIVKRQVNGLKCANNLKQIALALVSYRIDNNDEFPYRLRSGDTTFDAQRTANTENVGMPPKIFLCPFDPVRGTRPGMGRANAWSDNYERIRENGSSYCYEASSIRDDRVCNSNDRGYFWRDLATAPAANTVSWADGKRHQLKFGNLKDATKAKPDYRRWGLPFTEDTMPIVRCYWHEDWNKYAGGNTEPRKVLNISMGLNVFWSRSYWEKDITPNIDN